MNEEYMTSIPSPQVGPSSETGAFISEHYIIDSMGRYVAYIVYENAVRIITWMEDIEEWGTPSTHFDKDEARKAYVHAIENGAKEVDLNTDNLTKIHAAEPVNLDTISQMTDAMKAYEDMKNILYKDSRSDYDNYALKA